MRPTQPQNFDILHGYVHQVPQILPAGVMQPLDTSKISLWTGGTTLWDAPPNEPTDLSVLGETGPRFGAQGIGTSVYLEDPDGNTVELRHY